VPPVGLEGEHVVRQRVKGELDRDLGILGGEWTAGRVRALLEVRVLFGRRLLANDGSGGVIGRARLAINYYIHNYAIVATWT
jgi:hypothetical protein